MRDNPSGEAEYSEGMMGAWMMLQVAVVLMMGILVAVAAEFDRDALRAVAAGLEAFCVAGALLADWWYYAARLGRARSERSRTGKCRIPPSPDPRNVQRTDREVSSPDRDPTLSVLPAFAERWAFETCSRAAADGRLPGKRAPIVIAYSMPDRLPSISPWPTPTARLGS
jgi:hypothetical protein